MSMWNSFQTDAAFGIRAEITTFRGGNGDEIHGYTARPQTDASRGGVLLLHHKPGFDELYMETAERLARHGYDVLVPDLYCRYGHGEPDDVAALVNSKGGVTDDSVMADAAAARDFLTSLPSSNGNVGVMGGCMGGRHSLLAASCVHGFAAAVDMWGGNVVMDDSQRTPARPIGGIEFTADLDAPLLGLFGNEDRSPSPKEVDLHEEALQRHHKDYEFHRYDGAGHSFFGYDGAAYRQGPAMDAWEQIFRFFRDHLSN